MGYKIFKNNIHIHSWFNCSIFYLIWNYISWKICFLRTFRKILKSHQSHIGKSKNKNKKQTNKRKAKGNPTEINKYQNVGYLNFIFATSTTFEILENPESQIETESEVKLCLSFETGKWRYISQIYLNYQI